MANIKFSFLVISLIATINSYASIAPVSSRSILKEPVQVAESDPQIINLNMQFKAKHKTVKSDLAMPFYQTAELEKKVDNKNVLIQVNPRPGKNSNEIAIEMKFYKSSGAKAFAKKEIIAKVGEESKISVKGMTVRITPVL